MPLSEKDLMAAVYEICEEKNIQVAVKESLKGGVITGACAFLGGIIGGPIGLALGGALGGGAAAYSAQGKFQSAVTVIVQMPAHKRNRLIQNIKKAFSNVGVTDIALLIRLLTTDSTMSEIAVREVLNFLGKEMNMQIKF